MGAGRLPFRKSRIVGGQGVGLLVVEESQRRRGEGAWAFPSTPSSGPTWQRGQAEPPGRAASATVASPGRLWLPDHWVITMVDLGFR